MAGLNQTLMLALSMSVIAALIGAGGLGLVVYTGLGRLDVGTATAGGVGIVLLAIVLDRITQGLGEKKPIGSRTSVRDTLGKLFRPMAVGSAAPSPPNSRWHQVSRARPACGRRRRDHRRGCRADQARSPRHERSATRRNESLGNPSDLDKRSPFLMSGKTTFLATAAAIGLAFASPLGCQRTGHARQGHYGEDGARHLGHRLVHTRKSIRSFWRSSATTSPIR